jgi:CubicO group peptidase (beta-lactamase class C family)
MLRRLAVLFALLVSSSGHAADIPTRLDEIVRSYVADKGSMGSVLVARDGKILLNKGYGSANLEWSVPNTPTTKFGIGSMTKQFTAAAVLLLEERGKLKLDDPIARHIDAPEAWKDVTFFHLLTHTSGVPHASGFDEEWTSRPVAPKEQVARLASRPLDFPPGTKRQYSNGAYVVLGHLIEAVSGVSWADFVRANVLKPAGMADSGYAESEIVPVRAEGYRREGETFVRAPFVHPSVDFSAGTLHSTAEDLLRWEIALFGGKVVSRASLDKMTTPAQPETGMGLAISTAPRGHKQIWHNGGMPGYSSHLVYDPEEKLVVVVLSNVKQVAITDALAATLMNVAHGDTVILPSERKEVRLAPEVLVRYVGTYERVTPTFTLTRTVSLEGDHLVSQAAAGSNKGPVSRLYAESETSFFTRDADLQLQFFLDGGKPSRVVVSEGGGLGAEHKAVTATASAATAEAPAFPGYYRIVARHSGKAVIVQNASTAGGGDVVQRSVDGALGHGEWSFAPAADGYYLLAVRHSGKVMNVKGGSTADDADVIQSIAVGPASQWQVVESGDGYYRLVNRRSGKVAQVAGAGTAENADVVQGTWSSAAHQQFQVVAVP